MGEIAQMPHAEVVVWRAFYRRYPFDDLHRYHLGIAKVAANVAASGGAKGVKVDLPFRYGQASGEDGMIDTDAILP